jgi:hypothetical protein
MGNKSNINVDGLTHDQLQAVCWKRAQQIYYPFLDQRLFCIPNDMHAGNVARWKQYEALGVTPGIWDMQLVWFAQIPPLDCLWVCPAIHWFEFKVGNDRLSAKQISFQKRMERVGHQFHVISRECDFISKLELIIKPTLHIAKEIWKEELEQDGKGKARA